MGALIIPLLLILLALGTAGFGFLFTIYYLLFIIYCLVNYYFRAAVITII